MQALHLFGGLAGRPCLQRQPRRAPQAAAGPRPQRRAASRAAVEPDVDIVLVPWSDSAEESWSKEAQEAMDRMLARFKAADKDGNGVIDRQEFKTLLQRVGGGDEEVAMDWLPEEEIDAIFKRYDADKNGVISFDEFVAMTQDNIFLAGQLAEYQKAFNAVDAGGNGTVGATELYHLFQKMGNPISYEKLVKVFDKYDADGSGLIDFSEFLRMFKDELLDLQEILAYIKMRDEEHEEARRTRAAAASAAPPPPPPPAAQAPELAPGSVTTVFSEAELTSILHANAGRLVVLMASTTWCRPCKMFGKNYEALAKHYAGTVVCLKLFGNSNDDTKRLFKEKLKARTTPSFYFFRGSKLLGQCQGANGSRLEYNLRLMFKEKENQQGLLFPPYTPSGDFH